MFMMYVHINANQISWKQAPKLQALFWRLNSSSQVSSVTKKFFKGGYR